MHPLRAEVREPDARVLCEAISDQQGLDVDDAPRKTLSSCKA